MKKLIIGFIFIIAIQQIFAAPHGDNPTSTDEQVSDQFIGKWLLFMGSIVPKDKEQNKTIGVSIDNPYQYYLFNKKNVGELIVGKKHSAFTWNYSNGSLQLKYKDGYGEDYSIVAFTSKSSLSLAGDYDYYQNGKIYGVYLTLVNQDSPYFQ